MPPSTLQPGQTKKDQKKPKSERATQPLTVANVPDALLKVQTASVLSGMSEATLYRRAKDDPQFPKLIKLGARCTRIRAGDLTAWMAAQAAKAGA